MATQAFFGGSSLTHSPVRQLLAHAQSQLEVFRPCSVRVVVSQVCDVSLSKVTRGEQEQRKEPEEPVVKCYPLQAGEACCGPCLCRLYCSPGSGNSQSREYGKISLW